MKKKFSFKSVWQALKDSFKGFSEHKITKLSASLAYYTVFSLGPLLLVIISLAGIFFGEEAVQGSIQHQIQGLVGGDAAHQIQDIIKNASKGNKGTIGAIIGFVTLIIGASSMFGEMQDSLNTIWELKPKPHAGWKATIKKRLLSFSVVGSLAFLLLVSLTASALIEGLNERLKSVLPDVTVVLFYILNIVITLGITAALFAIIFKVLPDATIKFKDIIVGSIFTAILFMLGKFAIGLYINKSDVGSTYGAAGSLVVLLVWVYYSSIILYFGAEFTKAYALKFGAIIKPSPYAEVAKTVTVSVDDASLQDVVEKTKDKEGEEAITALKQPTPKPQPVIPKGHYHHKKPPFAFQALGVLALLFMGSKKSRQH
jgi:membrane protein